MRHVIRKLGLKGINVLNVTVAKNSSFNNTKTDIVVSRGFGSLLGIIDKADLLLPKGGKILAFKGPGVDSEITKYSLDIKNKGFKIAERLDFTLPFVKHRRILILLENI